MSKKFIGTFGFFIKLNGCGDQNKDFCDSDNMKNDICYDKDVFDGRGIESDPHVTVHMGLELNGLDIFSTLKYICDNTKPFFVRAYGFGNFKNEKNDVLYIDIDSKILNELHELISNLFAKKWHYEEYHPHSTIAYLNKDTSDKYIEKLNPDCWNSLYTVDKLIFKEFKKDKYLTLDLVTKKILFTNECDAKSISFYLL